MERTGSWEAPAELEEALGFLDEEVRGLEDRWVALAEFVPQLEELGITPDRAKAEAEVSVATPGFGARLGHMNAALSELEARWVKLEEGTGERFGDAAEDVPAFPQTIADRATAEGLLHNTFNRAQALTGRWETFLEWSGGIEFSYNAQGKPFFKTAEGFVTSEQASQDAKFSSLLTQLHLLRAQIELYRLQHNDDTPALHDGWSVLTDQTNEQGLPVTAKDRSGGRVYGPYLSRQITNPLTESDKVCLANQIDPKAGWAIDPDNGMIYAVLPQATVRELGIENELGETILAY